MRRCLQLLILGLALGPVATYAATIQLVSSMDGPSANAGAGTGRSGSGSATLTFDDQTNLLSWSGSFSGLSQAFTVAHFHGPATPAQNAGVALGIAVTTDPGGLSGTFNGSATLSAGQASDLLAGLWYVNIHSAFAPGGEIRGQVLVPEPALTTALGACGVMLLLAGRRQTKTR